MPNANRDPDSKIHIPLSLWLLTGGIGSPPTEESFYRRAAERKAAHRRNVHSAEARRQAVGELEEEHGPVTLGSKLAGLCGQANKEEMEKGKKKRNITRKELMERFGPGTGMEVGKRLRASRAAKKEVKDRPLTRSIPAAPPIVVGAGAGGTGDTSGSGERIDEPIDGDRGDKGENSQQSCSSDTENRTGDLDQPASSQHGEPVTVTELDEEQTVGGDGSASADTEEDAVADERKLHSEAQQPDGEEDNQDIPDNE